MAQRVNVVLVDDIDGSDAVETVSFALDGVDYEIDLSEQARRRAAQRALASTSATAAAPAGVAAAAAALAAAAAATTTAPRPRTSAPGPARTAGTSPSGAGSAPRCARRTPPPTELARPQHDRRQRSGRALFAVGECFNGACRGTRRLPQGLIDVRVTPVRISRIGARPSRDARGTSCVTSDEFPPHPAPRQVGTVRHGKERTCSSGSQTGPAGWSSWRRKKPGCSATTTSAPSTSSWA